MRPSHIWKDLPPATRLQLAEAFWDDTEEGDSDAAIQHIEAIAAIARRLNFRAKSVQALPIEKKARHLAQLGDVSDAVATRALIAYHFASQRPMMAAFLNALGVANDNGLITAEDVDRPGSRQAPGGHWPARRVSAGRRDVVSEDALGRRRGHLAESPGRNAAISLMDSHFPWYSTCFDVYRRVRNVL